MRTVSGKEKMEGGNGTLKGIEIRKSALIWDIDMSDIDAN